MSVAFAPARLLHIQYFLTAYTLELKHHFRHSPPSSRSEEYDAWRDRALALEAELQAARAAASSEHIGKGLHTRCSTYLSRTSELLALKSAASISAQKSQVPESTTSASKKKGKAPKKSHRTSDPKKAFVLGVCPPPLGSTPRPKRKTPKPCASRAFSVLCRRCS
jgi:hypothetical protein